MMNADELRAELATELHDVMFVYNGKNACIIPHGLGKYTVDFDDVKDYSSLDALMSDKIFDGRSLNEIASKLSLGFA